MSAKSNLKRVTLELGGKSPFIICELNDEDCKLTKNKRYFAVVSNLCSTANIQLTIQVKRAAGDAAFSMYTNQGQSCCASSSIFVHESVYEKFIELSKEIAESLVVGDPFAPGVTQGSLVNEENFLRVLDYIELGKKEGARLVCGGSRVGNRGYFVQPTIFADVKDDMKIATDEVMLFSLQGW
jgi:aldehyde dehydrogenase (NAD+)